MAQAGDYRFRLKRQSPIPSNEGETGYRDSGSTYWCAISETKSGEAEEQGTAVFSVFVTIRIRNLVPLNANDRLIDTETDEIYHLHGIQRMYKDNETLVLAERRMWAGVV